MPQIKSAKKRLRQTAWRTARNKSRRVRVHTFVRAAEANIRDGKREQANLAFTKAMSELHRAVTKGVIKLSAASRRISRLNVKLKQLNLSPKSNQT